MLSHYGPNFSLVQVADMAAPGAFDEAVKGCDGVAHTASPTTESYNPDPQASIPNGIRFAISLLESAAKEPSVKSVVWTSSQVTAVQLGPNKKYHVTPESWNEECKAAWDMPIVPTIRRMMFNYACGKTEAEQQSWKWVKEHKPHFTFNCVLPSVNFGTAVRPDLYGFGTSFILRQTWLGNTLHFDIVPSQYFIDIEDTALLHLAALTQPDVQNERILGFVEPYSYNKILDIFRKIAPERKFAENVDEILDQGTVDDARALELLKRVKNGEGWTPLEESIKTWSALMLQSEEDEKNGKKWTEDPTDAIEKICA